MPNQLPMDPEWQHLIEKRSEQDRRASRKRADVNRRLQDDELDTEAEDEQPENCEEDRRSGTERRGKKNRRKQTRRDTDAES